MTKQRQPLTYKEKKLIKGIAEGKTKRQAAIEAYHTSTPESASVIASQTLKKVNVQEALEEAFERHGITIDRAVKPIADGLVAYKPGYTDKQGEFHEGTDDHSVRLKASSMAFGLMGLGKGEGSTVNNILVVVTDKKNKYGF